MIQTLNISNFQSHKHTTLTFSPGVNVITGASDSGKTAILRALRWLIWNRPNGEDFRSDWGGDTIVALTVSNNLPFDAVEDCITVIREKGSENIYEVLGLVDMGTKTLKAFGTKVPEEVQKALNIDDTNLQKQFDSPFLISSSPGEVAAYFNGIAHLERIDSSVSYVNGKIISLTAKQKVDKISLEEAQEELKHYTYLDKFEIDLEELEHQQSLQTQQIVSRKRLSEHLNLMSTNEQMILKQEQVIALEKPVDKLLVLYGEKRQMEEEMSSLKITLIAVRKKKAEEDVLKKKAKLLPEVKALLKLHKDREELWQNRLALREALQVIRNTTNEQTTWETILAKKEKQFHENMPNLCPLCGNKTA